MGLLALVAVMPVQLLAIDRDVKAVLVTGTYGLVAGTAAGAISYPMTKSVRGVFIGSSIGLYLGIAAGVYYITHREDPDNPLRLNEYGGARGGLAADTEADALRARATVSSLAPMTPYAAPKPMPAFAATVYRF